MAQKWSVQYLRALENMHVQAVRTQKTALKKATQIRTTTLEWKNMQMEDNYSDLVRTDILLVAAGRRIDRIMRYTRSNIQGIINFFSYLLGDCSNYTALNSKSKCETCRKIRIHQCIIPFFYFSVLY